MNSHRLGVALLLFLLILFAPASGQPTERARELIREHRYGRALELVSRQESDQASVLRFILLCKLGQVQEADSVLKTIDVRTVSEKDSFDQVEFFLARGALESNRSDELAEKNYREAIRRSQRPDEEIKARLSLAGAILQRNRKVDDEVRKLFEQAGLLLAEAQHPETLSFFLIQQAGLLRHGGMKEGATPLYLAALDKAKSADLPLVAATCYQSLAWDSKRRRDNPQACEYQDQAVRICIAEEEWQQAINRLTTLSYMHEDSVESQQFYKDELLHALNSNPPTIHRLKLYALLCDTGGADAESWARKGLEESDRFPEERVVLLTALASKLEGKAPTEEVLALYREAEKIAQPKAYREYSGSESSLGMVRFDMAQTLLREHRYSEAREMLDRAASAEQEPGRRWYLCRALNLASDTSLRLGDLASAKAYFRKVVQVIRAAESEMEASILAAGLLHIHTYSALLEGMESEPSSLILGISPLAEELLRSELQDEDTYRLFIDIFDRRIEKDRQTSAVGSESLRYRGLLYEATDRREEARRAYESAFQSGDGYNRHADLIDRLGLAKLAYKEGGWEAAREELRKSLSTAQGTSEGDYFYIAVGWVELELENYSEALKIFGRVESERSKSLALYGAARAQIGLQQYQDALKSADQALNLQEGQSLALQGRLYQVRGEAQRLSGRTEESREDYLRAIEALETTRQWASLLESYMGLRQTLVALGRTSEAAEIYAKAATTLESVAEQIEPGKLRADGLLELTNSTQQASKIGRTAASDRQGFLLIQERLKRRHPDRIKLDSPYSASQILALRETLPDDSVIVFIQSFPSETYISAFTRTEILTREVGVGQAEIRARSEQLLESLQNRSDNSKPSQRQLYDLLLLPVEDVLREKTRWRFLPTSEIKSIPLGALVDSQGSTVSRQRIVSLLPQDPDRIAPRLKATEDTSILLLGAPTGQDLKGARAELLRLGGQFPKSSLLIGEDATTASFLKEIANHSIVHIASHASDKGIELNDKYLSLREIFEASLSPGTLVVLSACETARSKDHGSSLAEAFQVAGASAVIASQWRVDDLATAVLFEHFYAGIRSGYSADEALARAQRKMQGDEKWGSAYFWGGFVLIEAPSGRS